MVGSKINRVKRIVEKKKRRVKEQQNKRMVELLFLISCWNWPRRTLAVHVQWVRRSLASGCESEDSSRAERWITIVENNQHNQKTNQHKKHPTPKQKQPIGLRSNKISNGDGMQCATFSLSVHLVHHVVPIFHLPSSYIPRQNKRMAGSKTRKS